MKQFLLFLGILISINIVSAQNVGIGTATPKDLSKLDVESTTSGFLLPRMTTIQRNTLGGNVSALGATISAQYNGLMVYDITNNTLYMWDSNKTDFANGGWNNVLDADASVNDADADPTNEIQDLSLSGNTLSLSGDATTVNLAPYLDNTDDQKIDVFNLSGTTLNLSLESDGEANKTVDFSSLVDHDWYKVGTTTPPTSINDNIFTQGNVGIGTTSPQKKLEVIGDISLPNSSGGKSIYTWAFNDANWRIGMHNDNAIVGFSRALATSHVEYATFASGAGQGFAVGDNATGFSSFETTGSGSGYKSYFRGFVGIGTANIPYQLTLGSTGNVFGVENTATFLAKNSSGTYESYFWPRWSDNIMYMNYGSGGMNLRNNASQTAIFIDNDRSIDIKKGVLFNCDDCGDGSTIDGNQNWGDLTIQGRVLSTNSNLHLSPPNGFNVVINDNYRAAGGATGGSAGLVVEGVSYLEGGLETDKRYYYFQRYRYCNCYGAGNGSYDMGAWDFCALAQVGFKNNQSSTDEDDDVQCAVYPSGQGGYGEQTDYNTNFTQNHNQRPTWIMYLEAYEDTNGVTCAANCINFRH